MILMALLVSGFSCGSTNSNRQKCLQYDSNGLCIECNSEFFLENNLCYLCSNACLNCHDKSHCGQCMTGYRLTADKKCFWKTYDVLLVLNGAFLLLSIEHLVLPGFCLGLLASQHCDYAELLAHHY